MQWHAGPRDVAAVPPSDQKYSWERSAAAVRHGRLSRYLGPMKAGQPPGAWSGGVRRRWLEARANEFAKKQRLPATPSTPQHHPNASRANLPRPRSADTRPRFPLSRAPVQVFHRLWLTISGNANLNSWKSACSVITTHFSDLRMRCLRLFRDHCRLVSLNPFED